MLKTSIKYNWKPLFDGERWYVDESTDGQGGFVRYGPVPKEMIDPLIQERKARVTKTFEALLSARVP